MEVTEKQRSPVEKPASIPAGEHETWFSAGVPVNWARVEDHVQQIQHLTWQSWSTALEDDRFQQWFAGWLSAIRQSGLQWRKKGEAKFAALIDLLTAEGDREIAVEQFEEMLKAVPLRWAEQVEMMQKVDQQGRVDPKVRELVSRLDALSSEVILEVYPYVARVSHKYSNRLRSASLSSEDLASRAYFAIPMAFRSWEKARGPFQKVLRLWITQEMMDELLVQSTVHEPEQINFIRTRLRESEFALRQSLQRQPTVDELAEHSGQPVQMVWNLVYRPVEIVSMDAGLQGDNPAQTPLSLHDLLPSDLADPAQAAAGEVDRSRILAEIRRLVEPHLKKTDGALGFQLPLHLLEEADGEAMSLPDAVDLLREIGYENLRAKLTPVGLE